MYREYLQTSMPVLKNDFIKSLILPRLPERHQATLNDKKQGQHIYKQHYKFWLSYEWISVLWCVIFYCQNQKQSIFSCILTINSVFQFHRLICWRYADFKDLVLLECSIHSRKMCCIWGTYSSNSFPQSLKQVK